MAFFTRALVLFLTVCVLPCYADGSKAIVAAFVSGTELKSWSFEELKREKQVYAREVDPETGKKADWKGVSISALIDSALTNVSVDRKAQIDLVILRAKDGKVAMIPRAFVVKYPLVVAQTAQSLSSIVPIATRPKVLREGLPIETYFLKNITRIELANYREYYEKLFLKRRTDPGAMRGEKIYIQNCMACHSTKAVQARDLASSHSKVKGVPQLSERDTRAVMNYFDAYQAETQQ